MRSFDCHAHIFERGLPLAPVRRYAPTYDATAEHYLEMLKADGINGGLLVQPSFLGVDNSYILAALKKYPGKLRGVAVVEPTLSDADFQALHVAGFTGIRLNLTGLPLPDLYQPEWTAMLKRLREHEWHVEILRESRDLPALLKPLLEAGVKVVLDHFGKPDMTLFPNDPVFDWLLRLGVSRRVWIKISASYHLRTEDEGEMLARHALPQLMASYGPDRLLWGSDWPHTNRESSMNFSKTLEDFRRRIPDVYVQEIILKKSPAELFAPMAQ